MDKPTALSVLNDAAVELGWKKADSSDPFAETDQAWVLLCRSLRRVGKLLVRARDWTHLTKEYTFPTVASTASYALPTDFARVKDSTLWNRDTAQPLGQSVDARAWQELQATTAAGVLNPLVRFFGNKLYIYPTPSAAEDIYYEYVSSYWVMPTGQTVPTASTTTAKTDTLWFDEPLLVAGVKLAYLRAKGFDQTAALQDFKTAWDAAVSADGLASDIALSPRRVRLLDTRNLPDTGWGL